MSSPPLQGELRFWPELATLMSDPRFWFPSTHPRRPSTDPRRPSTDPRRPSTDPRHPSTDPRDPSAHPRRSGRDRQPVLLIPGFLAGDASLTVMAGWLRRRGHRVRTSGIRFNVGCSGRDLDRLDAVLTAFGEPVVLIGQSRGGTLARALAARHPDRVAALVTLGSPVLDPLAVAPSVLRTIRSVAFLGDLGLPGLFSTECRDGDCCAEFRSLLTQPLPPGSPALALYSRSDAIVDWRACLDPDAECVEIDGSHCGMAVNAQVYREVERLLER